MDRSRLKQLLGKLPETKILVVGDFFLDKYLIIEANLAEVSIETGLTAHQVVSKRLSPGAAGTVTSNIRANGVGTVTALSVIGCDGEGYELKRALEGTGVGTSHIIETDSRFTPTYTKPMLRENGVERELERQDIKNRSALSTELEDAIIEKLNELVPQVDGVVVADQVQERNCGVITDRVREEIARLARKHPGKWFLADSRLRAGEFRNVAIKPNKYEAARALGEPSEGAVSYEQAQGYAAALAERNGLPVFVTAEEKGIILAEGGVVIKVPSVPVEGEIDPVGAGDSCISGIISILCAGGTCEEAAAVGNMAASVTVKKIGTTGTASPDEILLAFERWPGRV